MVAGPEPARLGAIVWFFADGLGLQRAELLADEDKVDPVVEGTGREQTVVLPTRPAGRASGVLLVNEWPDLL